LSLPQYPQPRTQPAKFQMSKYLLFGDNLPHTPTVWDAIGDLPEVELIPELLERDWAIAEYGKPSDYSYKLRCYQTDNCNYGYERIAKFHKLTSSIRTQHGIESVKRFQATLPGTTEAISRFYKLEKHGICNTLRAGTPSHKGAFTAPRPIHPSTPRCITVREAARLHSYPDWFRFHVTKWHGFRQVGNSVPPLLAQAIASEIIRSLGIAPSKPNINLSLGDEPLLNFTPFQAARYYGISNQERRKKKNTQEQVSDCVE
ncbi:MAG: DNA cytosine methyltransferase, partial [Richelia sp.]|nr:DNA cytosine methyltransferase [Richelia sp.]